MADKGNIQAQVPKPDANRDRILQVLALEYGTLRTEILMRLSARYQFVGFITAAAALVGVGIGYSSGPKTWLLVTLALAVLYVGFHGYYRMVYYGRLVSVRIAEIEDRSGWRNFGHLRFLLIASPGVSLLRPLPRTRPLPDLSAGGFCQGVA